jgi:predicted DNA-binding protein (MmcQ/YjbR family)
VAEPHPEVVDPRHPLIERVRSIALQFPEAVEVPAWGRPTFRAGKKIFVFVGATMEQPHTIVIKPDPLDAPALRQDSRLWSPPYWGPSGWLAIALDAPETDWRELTELIDASYRQVALKRQLQALDLDPVVR